VDARALTGSNLETLSYDLIGIRSGPAGQGAAIQAAKLGKRAALVERQGVLGGTSTSSSAIPSKTLRAAVVELRGRSQGIYRRPCAAELGCRLTG